MVSKRTVLNVLKYALALGLLGYVIYSNWDPPNGQGLQGVWQRHVVQGEPVHLGFLGLGFVLFSFSLTLTLFRWYLLVRAQDLPFRVSDALRLGYVGFFFNTFLPGAVGGDIVKAAFLAREQNRRTVAVATVLMDRAIALWALIWFVALLGGVFWLTGQLSADPSSPSKSIVATAAGIVAVSALVWLLLGLLPDHRAERFAGRLEGIPRIGTSAAEFWRAVWMYRRRQKAVAAAMLISWIGHVGFVSAFYCCARTFWDGDVAGNPLPTYTQFFLLVPIGLVIQAVPLFPGGAGIGELGFAKLFLWFQSDQANGVMASLVMRMNTWVLGLLSLGIYLRLKAQYPALDKEPRPESELATKPRDEAEADAISTGEKSPGVSSDLELAPGTQGS